MPRPVQKRKWLVPTIALGAILTAALYYVDAKRTEQRLEADELKAALSVSVLPAGTEEAWSAYVDRRIAATMQREGRVIHVVGMLDRILSKTTIVSANSPYAISCDPLGAGIQFGYGDDAIKVSVFGVLAEISAEKAPALGVNPRSIAAVQLREHLCRRISARVQAIMD